MQNIGLAGTALGANRNLVVILYPTAGTSGNGLIGIVRRIGDRRLTRCPLRQLNGIFELRSLIARQLLAIEINHLERGVGGLLDREGDEIDRSVAIACRHRDTGLAINATRQHRNRLELIALDRLDSGQLGGTDRQKVGIFRLVGREVRQLNAADTDARQSRNFGFRSGANNLIDRIVAAGCRNGDTRSTIDTAIGDLDRLLVLALGIRDGRNGRRTHGEVDIIGKGHWVEVLQIAALNLQITQIGIGRFL